MKKLLFALIAIVTFTMSSCDKRSEKFIICNGIYDQHYAILDSCPNVDSLANYYTAMLQKNAFESNESFLVSNLNIEEDFETWYDIEPEEKDILNGRFDTLLINLDAKFNEFGTDKVTYFVEKAVKNTTYATKSHSLSKFVFIDGNDELASTLSLFGLHSMTMSYRFKFGDNGKCKITHSYDFDWGNCYGRGDMLNHSHYMDNLNAKAKPETVTYSVTGTTVKIKGYGSWKISDDKRSMTEISSGVKMVKK